MTTTGTTPPPGQPRWLYQAQDAQGRPTEGFVHAQTAEEAMQAIAALQQPPLTQVQLHTSGLYARAITEMADDALGTLDVKALRQLARDQIEAQENPGLWTTLRQLLRNNRIWLLVCAALVALAVWRQWSPWVQGILVLAMLAPLGVFAYMHRFQRVY